MMNMGKRCIVLAGVLTLLAASALAPPKETAEGPADATKDKAKAIQKMSRSDNETMGQFVLEQIEAGKSGEDLAAAIKEKRAGLAKAPKAEKEKPDDAKVSEEAGDSGKAKAKAAEAKARRAALAKKHGLADDDFPGLGKFVNKNLDEGLRGEELAAAIKEELNQRKADRQENKAAMKDQKDKDKDKGDDKQDTMKDKAKDKSAAKDKTKDKARDKGPADKGKKK